MISITLNVDGLIYRVKNLICEKICKVCVGARAKFEDLCFLHKSLWLFVAGILHLLSSKLSFIS